MIWTGLAVILLTAGVLSIAANVRRRFRADLKSPENRGRLWDRLYGWDWGEQSTNNYGYAPTALTQPEKYQIELYRALFAMAGDRNHESADLLEVSCGRGGGLAHIVREAGGTIRATGLDLSPHALDAARRLHGNLANLEFVRGSALELPFADSSFDIVLNVEASHEYPDLDAFFAEVRRVLRPGGVFLHCGIRTAAKTPALFETMGRAGFEGETRDITANVAEACRLDSPRRARLLRSSVPWPERLLIGGWLRNYAALEGTRRFQRFSTGRLRYFMSCLTARQPGQTRVVDAGPEVRNSASLAPVFQRT